MDAVSVVEYIAFILLAIAILLVMVLIHEAGHYTLAKLLGFTVDEFSVGFGPKLFSRVRKNGERFSLRLLPLGGYCAFYEDPDIDKSPEKEKNRQETDAKNEMSQENDGIKPEEDLLSYVMRAEIEDKKKIEEDRKKKEQYTKTAEEPKPIRLDKDGKPAKYYNEQKPWKRIIVLLGGVLFNFLSAIIFSLVYIWAVGAPAPQVAEIYTDAAGEPYCQLVKGDILLAVDGSEINIMTSYGDLVAELKEDDTVTFTVDRGGKIIDVSATKKKITYKYTDKDKNEKEETYVGFGFSSTTVFIGSNAKNAFTYCVPYTFKLSWSILGSFGAIITGEQPITSMTGPVGSIKTMADVSFADARNILILLPLLASNLAIFNLLPFPALDGAHIVFTIIEWIRKKPINRKAESMVHLIGMGVLLLFVIIVDILSFAL